jgi:hypothetical protein
MKNLAFALFTVAVFCLVGVIWVPDYRWEFLASAVLASFVGAGIASQQDKR